MSQKKEFGLEAMFKSPQKSNSELAKHNEELKEQPHKHSEKLTAELNETVS